MPIILLVLLFAASLFSPIAGEPIIHIESDSQESITLPFTPEELRVDEVSEKKMLESVNTERRKAGVSELVMDEGLIEVARKHSHDMWERQYFAHENPDGENAVHRMLEGEVDFARAGENLALTKSVERAHEGLMDSPGHKRNILDPKFGRIGIGVVDGGVYGKMFTQNFAD
ncbi:MAG: CAP domain-containing protein [Candidatus Zambryskibacteria bacterium]|nr:CAP domain-containing protein [Candidatus Zambryskibacteria bacterium]